MLRTPSVLERKASGVGIQVWKVALIRRRKSFVGSQCAGKLDSNIVADGQTISSFTLKVKVGMAFEGLPEIFSPQKHAQP